MSTLIVPHNKHRGAQRLLAGAGINATWDKPPSVDDVTKRDDERLLAHIALSAAVHDSEAALIKQLLSQYGAEQVACAFVRLVRDGQSAPEELQDVELTERPKRQRRENFTNSVWFSLSVGYKQNAEPGWLLPVLCRDGDLSKPDIGAIKIQQDHTFVEIDADCVDRFLSNIGPNKTLQKSIKVKRLESAPDLGKDGFRKATGFKNSRDTAKKNDSLKSALPRKPGADQSTKSKFKPDKKISKPRKHKKKSNTSTRTASAR